MASEREVSQDEIKAIINWADSKVGTKKGRLVIQSLLEWQRAYVIEGEPVTLYADFNKSSDIVRKLSTSEKIARELKLAGIIQTDESAEESGVIRMGTSAKPAKVINEK